MTIIRAGIIGTGSYLPEKIVTNYDLEKIIDTNHDWIVERTGIAERRVADEDTASSDTGAKAALKALEDAGLRADELDMMIVATVSGDMSLPSTACFIQAKIGAVKATCFDINAACTGFIYGLDIANAFITGGQKKNILVIGVETLSKIVNWQDRGTAILFGDGAGAAIVSQVGEGRGIFSSSTGSDGNGAKYLYQPAGGTRMPASEETVKNKLHTVHMDGGEVFKFAARKMVEATTDALSKENMSFDDIDRLIPHQANKRIIENAAKKMKIPTEKIFLNIQNYGNMSAASIPVALDEAARSGFIKDDERVVLVGFGAGLTWGATVMKWGK